MILEMSNTGGSGEDCHDLDILRRTKYAYLPDDLFDLFRLECSHRGLSLFGKNAVPVVKWNAAAKRKELEIIITIDQMRLLALRTGKYAGQTAPQWAGTDGVWKDCWVSDAYPVWAKVGVIRAGCQNPFFGVARWASYCQGKRGKNGEIKLSAWWKRMGAELLAIRAEMQALRRGFPEASHPSAVDRHVAIRTPNDEVGHVETEPDGRARAIMA